MNSPLSWLALVPVASSAHTAGDLRGATFGITRVDAGAHTRGWREGHDYTVESVGSVDTLIRALGDGSIDAFL